MKYKILRFSPDNVETLASFEADLDIGACILATAHLRVKYGLTVPTEVAPQISLISEAGNSFSYHSNTEGTETGWKPESVHPIIAAGLYTPSKKLPKNIVRIIEDALDDLTSQLINEIDTSSDYELSEYAELADKIEAVRVLIN